MQSKNRQLLAIDPSLSCSGWAVFCLEECAPIRAGVIRPPGTELELSLRYDHLQQQVQSLMEKIGLGASDYVVCEGPAPLVKNPESALRVERVRSIFEAVGRSFGAKVMPRLNPRTVQSELLGLKGKQLKREAVKEIARAAALRLFGEETANLSQDSVDALLVGALAVSKVQLHLKTGVALESLFLPKRSTVSRGRGYRGWNSVVR